MQRPLKESSAFLFLTSYSPYIKRLSLPFHRRKNSGHRSQVTCPRSYHTLVRAQLVPRSVRLQTLGLTVFDFISVHPSCCPLCQPPPPLCTILWAPWWQGPYLSPSAYPQVWAQGWAQCLAQCGFSYIFIRWEAPTLHHDMYPHVITQNPQWLRWWFSWVPLEGSKWLLRSGSSHRTEANLAK